MTKRPDKNEPEQHANSISTNYKKSLPKAIRVLCWLCYVLVSFVVHLVSPSSCVLLSLSDLVLGFMS